MKIVAIHSVVVVVDVCGRVGWCSGDVCFYMELHKNHNISWLCHGLWDVDRPLLLKLGTVMVCCILMIFFFRTFKLADVARPMS